MFPEDDRDVLGPFASDALGRGERPVAVDEDSGAEHLGVFPCWVKQLVGLSPRKYN